MNLRTLKLELFYLRKSISYKKGFSYFYNKFILAPKILKTNKIFDKPVTHENLSIHVLTSRKDIIILIWSLASFYKAIKVIGKLYRKTVLEQ